MMPRRMRPAALVLATAAICIAASSSSTSVSAWTDGERASSESLQAGTVLPPQTMNCTAGTLSPVTFSWTNASGGLTRTGYRYTVTGALSASGTLAASATSVQFTAGLLGLGSGTFSLYAVGPGGWESQARTGTLGFLSLILSSCSVP